MQADIAVLIMIVGAVSHVVEFIFQPLKTATSSLISIIIKKNHYTDFLA